MTTVRIGMGSCGIAAGAQRVRDAVLAHASIRGVEVRTRPVGCEGACHEEVRMTVERDGSSSVAFTDVTPESVPALLDEVWGGEPDVDHRRLRDEGGREQTRIASRNCGLVDPEDVDDYRARGGYRGLERALSLDPGEVRRMVTQAGLRGRGGAGFVTGRKWDLAAAASDPIRFVICNADEGDPGAFMDRNLIEGDPQSILEGLVIAGWATGAQRGYVYVRHEYPLARERIHRAITQARAAGWLGTDIAGSGFDFEVDIRRGAGAFVCGEETALIASIEGYRGLPSLRPPYPTESGLFGHPTCINNVETLANVPWILEHGSEAFRAFGTATNPGTKVFCLAGDVRRPGMVEVPMGTTLRDVIESWGGGSERPIKAVQIGGPSGGCLPASLLDTPVEYEALAATGTMLGSGGLVVMDDRRCMVDVARYFMGFMSEESCGKCTACREGTVRLARILDRLCDGEGRAEDLDLIEPLSQHVAAASLCGLGKSAPNPLLTTLRYFRDEIEAHVVHRRCPAATCRSLIRYAVDGPRCDGCSVCLRACPADAIHIDPSVIPLWIDDAACVRCNACREVCPFDAVQVMA
jgi:NADH-quinone oxidoreductase subunit F